METIEKSTRAENVYDFICCCNLNGSFFFVGYRLEVIEAPYAKFYFEKDIWFH